MKKYFVGKLIVNLFAIVSCAILLWIGISYLEVAFNNLTPGYEYSSFNFFSNMIEWCGK